MLRNLYQFRIVVEGLFRAFLAVCAWYGQTPVVPLAPGFEQSGPTDPPIRSRSLQTTGEPLGVWSLTARDIAPVIVEKLMAQGFDWRDVL